MTDFYRPAQERRYVISGLGINGTLRGILAVRLEADGEVLIRLEPTPTAPAEPYRLEEATRTE